MKSSFEACSQPTDQACTAIRGAADGASRRHTGCESQSQDLEQVAGLCLNLQASPTSAGGLREPNWFTSQRSHLS